MKIFIPKNKIKINKPKNPFIITKFESKIYSLYNNGKIPYPVHLTKGNEVQLSKIFQYISGRDWVLSTWRNHGHALMHGINEKKLLKQIILGKSMYVSSKKNKFLSSSIAGGMIPIALGLALSIKRKKQKNKVWVFIGDMTSMMGSFYEVYNYSRNFNLPLEFVIEDNGKSVYTNTKRTWNIKEIKYPKDVFYYKFDLKYPHHGTGKWVSF